MVYEILSWPGARRLRALTSVISLSALLFLSSGPASAQGGSFGPVASNSAEDREQALTCLMTAIVYEAGVEPVEGQQAVAQVILNRARTPMFPNSICGVVYQGSERRTGCQFSFTCDGSLRRKVPDRLFQAARPIAEAALNGALPDRVGEALFYHAHYVSPRWAPRLDRITRIGAHIFYASPDLARQMLTSRKWPAGPVPSTLSERDLEPFLPWGLALSQVAAAIPGNRAID